MKNLFYAVIAAFIAMVATNEIVAYKTDARHDPAAAKAVAAAVAEQATPTAEDSTADTYISQQIDAQFQAVAQADDGDTGSQND